jgi:polyhydroxybutyrate depolymerase
MMRLITATFVAIAAEVAIAPACNAQRVTAATTTEAHASLTPGDHTVTLQSGGRTREYIVHVPRGMSAMDTLPLLLAFHGGGGEAALFQKHAGLDVVADREHFLVVYPNGTGIAPRRLLTWNAGECCGSAMKRNIDDVSFAVAVIDDVMRRTPVDTRRVYATGHSNGAMMAYRLAGERADRITAIAPVSGSYDLEHFAPSRPVAVLDIHSVDDPRALYAGGLGPPLPGAAARSSHRSVMASIHRFTQNNKCQGDSTVVESRSGNASANRGQTATLLKWKGCAVGGDVEQWRLTGVGHGWPGDDSSAPREQTSGPTTTIISAAEEVWKFVSRVRR